MGAKKIKQRLNSIGKKIKKKASSKGKSNRQHLKLVKNNSSDTERVGRSQRSVDPLNPDTLGTYLSTTNRLSKSMLYTGVHLLEHYLAVWESDKYDTLSELETNGFHFWGNKKNSSKAEAKSKENRIYKNSTYIETAHSPARALVAESDQHIVISFRGSGVQRDTDMGRKKHIEGVLKNAFADARVPLVKRAGFPGRVHIGFYEEYKNVRGAIKSALKKCSNIGDKQIYITGFSLGASMGALCYWDLSKNMSKLGVKKKPISYLFACPSPGDKVFNKELKKFTNLYLFAHEKDPIPQIPQGLFKNYETPGEKLFVFGTKRSYNKENCHKKAEHIRIKDIKIRVTGKEYLPKLALIATAAAFRKSLGLAAGVALTAREIIRPAAAFHNGYAYQNCLRELAKNFEESVHTKANLKSTHKRYQDLAQKGAVWSDYLKR